MSYVYEGANARRIRSFTRQKVFEVLTTALTGLGLTVGENDLVLLKSGNHASERLKEGRPFIYFANKPTKSTGVTGGVLCADGLLHSGEKHEWLFLVQMSKGIHGGRVTSEQVAAADDELMDQVRDALAANYGVFRDLHFYNLKVNFADDSRESGTGLNPLTVTFYNYTRLPVDTFIDPPT